MTRLRCALVCLLLLVQRAIFAQELFPNTEPASNLPKGVFGLRGAVNYYNEAGQPRTWTGYKFMYGISPNLMVWTMINASNHHGPLLPANFVSNDGFIGPHTHGGKKGIYYPYRFEGVHLYAKYRFLNLDGDHRHLRMAAYGEYSSSRVAHDEAEPNLMMGDNAGVGGGLIITGLYKKLALSTTVGGIVPFDFKGEQEMPAGVSSPAITIHYGNTVNYSLSAGFLALPVHYKSYEQTNVNLYAELIGKAYPAAKISADGKDIPISDALPLTAGNYIEARPAVQFIVRSNLRVDLCYAVPLVSRSYVATYPMYMMNVQYYFFPRKKNETSP